MADSTSSLGKRAGENTAAEHAQPKEQKREKPMLLVLPGASGKLARDVEEQLLPRLRELFDVHVRTESWNVGNVKATGNTAFAAKVGPQEKGAPDWYIMGASFGCRVAAAVVSEEVSATPPSLILHGYPAYGPPKKGQPPSEENSRLDALKELPETARVMFISGDRDEYIRKHVPDGRPQGQALFENQIIPSLKCSAKVHMVAGAGSATVPSASHTTSSKEKQAAACEQMIDCIKAFANL